MVTSFVAVPVYALSFSIIAPVGQTATQVPQKVHSAFSRGTSFSVAALRHQRERLRFHIALLGADPALCVQALAPLEPNVPWDRRFLLERVACYGRAHHPLEAAAREDFAEYEHLEGPTVAELLASAARPAPRR